MHGENNIKYKLWTLKGMQSLTGYIGILQVSTKHTTANVCKVCIYTTTACKTSNLRIAQLKQISDCETHVIGPNTCKLHNTHK